MKSNILEFRENIGTVVNKFTTLIGTDSDELIVEYAIEDSKEIAKALKQIENENRLLQVGIVGRVKAGKSSLLNALLFNGESVLPKAATPMTAALTQLSYGEVISAKVEFFSQEDIGRIKNDASKYNNEFEKQTDSIFQDLKSRKEKKVTLSKNDSTELREKAKRRAESSLRSNIALSASYDQYNRMQKSGIDSSILKEIKSISADSIENLSAKLLEYVGSSGKYMPFTKSVHIKLPQENLKDIMIIDTPGVNDPVQSREARTRELLKYCDVIFIVSPAGQFLSSEDIDLMDRITAKEGVHEIVVISSQVDTQLLTSMKEKHNGLLPEVLNGITSSLGDHLSSIMSELKERSPEVGSIFDKLIEQGKDKVIHSSGICQTIKTGFDNREIWDDGTKHVWGNLTREYPDYFSDTDRELSISNLDLLGNIAKINTIIADVRDQKDKILKKRKTDFIVAKQNSLLKYKEKLISYTKEQIRKVNDSDANDLKSDKKKLEKVQKKASASLDEEFFELVEDLSININKDLSNELNKHFRDTRKSVDGSEGSTTEDYQAYVGKQWIFFDKYETRSRTITSVRTGAVRSHLEDLTMEIENSIVTTSRSFISKWKKELLINLVKVLREEADDDDLDSQVIRRTIRSVINSVKYPSMDYSNDINNNKEKDNKSSKQKGLWYEGSSSSDLTATGVLTGASAEDYIDNARNYLSRLKKRVTRDIKIYISSLISSLNDLSPSEKIFGNYKERIEELAKLIENKEITIDSLERLVIELEGIK